MPDVVNQLRAFRVWAHTVNPAFGAQVDRQLLQSAGFGDSSDPLTSTLSDLQSNLQAIANATQLSVKNYLDAQTSIAQMVAASKAGLTVDQLNAIQQATYSTSIPSKATLFGLPLWLVLGGVGLAVFTFMESGGRRRR